MKRILVGFDGSAQAYAAAEVAADLARATGASLLLACVVEHPTEYTPELDAGAAQPWLEPLRDRARKSLHEVAGRLDRQGVQISEATPVGAPAHMLAQLATDPGVDLVVVGHRGRSKIARVLVGSVADRLVQISPKPVLVVR